MDLSELDTSNLSYLHGMFCDCRKIQTVTIKLNSNHTLDLSIMFEFCLELKRLKFIGNVNVDNTEQMFFFVTTTGTLYYPLEYADSYANIIAAIPDTWTAEAY
jgi:hypothetical protein